MRRTKMALAIANKRCETLVSHKLTIACTDFAAR